MHGCSVPPPAEIAFRGCSSVPAERCLIKVDVDLLGLEVALDPVQAELAPDPALLVPAPGHLVVGRVIRVDPGDPGADLADHPVGAGDVLGPDTGGEAVLGVVG